jgi:CO dehydrogenase/acetyl-CoA synthase beta subunit
MFISIGDIETYGFNLEKNITNMKINNQKADLINKKMIIANIAIDEMPENMRLPVNLSMMVAGKEVKKNIGVIDLIESVELR